MKKIKLCFVTAARSEYGPLKWLMKNVVQESRFDFKLIVTGAHLLNEQGHTIDQIYQDGFTVDYIVDANISTDTTASIAESMGRMAEGFAKAFTKVQPDYIVVLGDRYELLPICNTAFVMRIPIIHISGGDVTKGAIDDGIRNAITMLATYHFPGTKDSADNIIRMRGSKENVWPVGEPGLDTFNREKLTDRATLANELGLNTESKWVLLTYHAETIKPLDYNLNTVKNCISVLDGMSGYQIIATYSNLDFGGDEINRILEDIHRSNPDKFKAIASLGHLRYISLMKQVSFVIGNSSSGIVEAPFLGIPVINIGDRQKGRYQCQNVVQSSVSRKCIIQAVDKCFLMNKNITDANYWGDGHACDKIISILNEIL